MGDSLKQTYSAEIVKRELLTDVPWKAIRRPCSRQFSCSKACSRFILPRTKQAARDMLLRLKILGSGFLPQAGISQKQFKYSYAELIEEPTTISVQEMQTALFCFPSWKLQAQFSLSHPCK